ncbi:unnamed protein product [Lasius platythorax]|uniref:DM domain-containing protein n=1 Tax=Lasius platythorax TaxID=488582 RepID=A0AAV2N562_9HYME
MSTKDTCGSEKSSIAGSHKSSVEKTNKKKRTATCSLCKNHNLIELYTEGHKTNCPGQYCMCSKCDQKRKHQKQTAAETRKSRAKKNERLIQERQRQKENSLVLAKSSSEGSSKQVPFLIDSANELLIENWESKGLLIEKVACVLSSKELKTEAKERQRGLKRQRNTPKANQQEKNVEEIIFPKDLEHLLQHTVYSCCPIYDIRIINLVNEIVATILQYRSTADAEITLNDAKDRISFPSIIRHLKIIQRIIARFVILSFVIIYLTYYLFLFIYYLFPP